jgi:hypothetical protein
MTYVERMIVRRGHPKHIIVGIVAFLWVVYFLWQHNWIWAAAAVVLSAVLGWLPKSGTKRRDACANIAGQDHAVASSSRESDVANGRLCSAPLWRMGAFDSVYHGRYLDGLPRPHVGLAQGK